MKLGFSLSLCIQDIIEGLVTDLPDAIIVSTKIYGEGNWEYLIDQYCTLYWRKDPVRAKELVAKLRSEGRIINAKMLTTEERWHDIPNS